MGIFDMFKKKVNTQALQEQPVANNVVESDEYIDDITFIRKMRHITEGVWHRYDVVLAARGYGWENMIMWADYMTDADLNNVSEVTVGTLEGTSNNITDSYLKNGGKCSETPELKNESGILTVAGRSKALKAPVKIVWINQTQVFTVYTLISDEKLLARYVESTIRRNFGTENEMKLGKPIPEGK